MKLSARQIEILAALADGVDFFSLTGNHPGRTVHSLVDRGLVQWVARRPTRTADRRPW
jgi:hypothetical protein